MASVPKKSRTQISKEAETVSLKWFFVYFCHGKTTQVLD